jgi:Ca-activated chloride channel family protein
MIRKKSTALFVILLTSLTCSQAFGLIIVDRSHPTDRFITLTQQHVDVAVKDGVAQTTIEQVFHNNELRELEGTYLFPIPEGASVSNFTMLIGGVEVKGEILDREQAARKYHEIVRQMKDPGLLEYVGKDLFQARVYPIPPHSDVKIKVMYQQVLPYDNGVTTYRFTSEDPKFYAAPIKDYRLTVNIESKSAIKAVYSPTHNVQIDRPHDKAANVLFTRSEQTTTKDFVLYYSVSKDEVGCNLLTYYDKNEYQGYFLGLIAPDLKQKDGQRSAKNVLFVLDVSGSMAGGKIEQAKEALRFCLNSLNPDDLFGIVSYSDDVERHSDRILSASRDNIREALAYVDGLVAEGGTDINGALLEALSIEGQRSHADYMIFLTDGEPTVGETNSNRIAENIKAANNDGWKIFCFGVGYDVKAGLLDQLSSESGAVASYVRPKEDIEIKVSNFFSKIANPAMTDIKLVCDDNRLSQTYPRQLPDLFYGMQLVVAGKFDSPGSSVIKLEGFVEGEKKVLEYNVDFSRRSESDNLVPRQWAIRRIGFLLDEIGKNPSNGEIKEEIVRLSKQYGIVTPYTSFFVEDPALAYLPHDHRGRGFEPQSSTVISSVDGLADAMTVGLPSPLGAERDIDRSQVSKKFSGDVYGQYDADGDLADLTSSDGSGYIPRTELEEKVAEQVGSGRLSQLVTVGDRTFQRVGETLVDSRFDGTQEMIKIRPFSDAYFRLLEIKPETGKYLSIGGEILVVVGGVAVKICEDGENILTDEMMKLIG